MAALETVSAGHYRLVGEVELEGVKALLSLRLEPADGAVEVDLSGLENASSAAAALMVKWCRESRREEVSMRYVGVPERLMALLRLYDLPPLLGLQAL